MCQKREKLIKITTATPCILTKICKTFKVTSLTIWSKLGKTFKNIASKFFEFFTPCDFIIFCQLLAQMLGLPPCDFYHFWGYFWQKMQGLPLLTQSKPFFSEKIKAYPFWFCQFVAYFRQKCKAYISAMCCLPLVILFINFLPVLTKMWGLPPVNQSNFYLFICKNVRFEPCDFINFFAYLRHKCTTYLPLVI